MIIMTGQSSSHLESTILKFENDISGSRTLGPSFVRSLTPKLQREPSDVANVFIADQPGHNLAKQTFSFTYTSSKKFIFYVMGLAHASKSCKTLLSVLIRA